MADEYTPTTEDVRLWYSVGVWNDGVGRDTDGSEFDRWLAKRDREVSAKAWGEGWAAGNAYAVDDFNRDGENTNPYREDGPIVTECTHGSCYTAPNGSRVCLRCGYPWDQGVQDIEDADRG